MVNTKLTAYDEIYGELFVNENGYWELRNKIGSEKLLHRIIFAEFYDIPLSAISDLVVHHRNGDKLNNNIENLQLLNRSSHALLHALDFLDEDFVLDLYGKGRFV